MKLYHSHHYLSQKLQYRLRRLHRRPRQHLTQLLILRYYLVTEMCLVYYQHLLCLCLAHWHHPHHRLNRQITRYFLLY